MGCYLRVAVAGGNVKESVEHRVVGLKDVPGVVNDRMEKRLRQTQVARLR